eukprot:gb/GECG01009890.1/.p1 GENE.gb/GECG01009890.1/~~gb/GECG01009890.1/.p1  ORF type:complete len:749 (+),score=100.42 gb/GECG01009890.1/:1-2247(+)
MIWKYGITELFGKPRNIPETCQAAIHPHRCDWEQITEEIASRNLALAKQDSKFITLKLPGEENANSTTGEKSPEKPEAANTRDSDDEAGGPQAVGNPSTATESREHSYETDNEKIDFVNTSLDLAFAAGPADEGTGRKIDRDINRTFPLFNSEIVDYDLPINHLRLRCVLRALASNRGYGFYTQGMNLICALLLLGSFKRYPVLADDAGVGNDNSGFRTISSHERQESSNSGGSESGLAINHSTDPSDISDPNGPSQTTPKRLPREKQVYCIVRYLFDDCNMLQLFENATPALDVYIHCFSKYLDNKLPAVSRRLQEVNFATHAFAIEWFTALFSTVVPLHVCLCIIDLLVSQKLDNVLFRMSVAILNNVPGLTEMSEDELMLSLKPAIVGLDFAKIFREAMNLDSESDVLNMMQDGINALPLCYREAVSPMEALLNEELLSSPIGRENSGEGAASSDRDRRSSLLRDWRKAQNALHSYVPISKYKSLMDVAASPPTHRRVNSSDERWLDVEIVGHENSDSVTFYKIRFRIPMANVETLVLRRYSEIRTLYMKMAAKVERCLEKLQTPVRASNHVSTYATIEEEDGRERKLSDAVNAEQVSTDSSDSDDEKGTTTGLDSLPAQEVSVQWHSVDDMPPLPPKKYFGSRDLKFIEQRKQQLHTLFRALSHPLCPLMRDFLTRYHLWNASSQQEILSHARGRSPSTVARDLISQESDGDVFRPARQAFFELFNTSDEEILGNLMKANMELS